MSARFPPAVACVRISCLFKAEKHSTVCLHHTCFIHSSNHGHKLLPFSYRDKSCCEHGNTYICPNYCFLYFWALTQPWDPWKVWFLKPGLSNPKGHTPSTRMWEGLGRDYLANRVRVQSKNLGYCSWGRLSAFGWCISIRSKALCLY